MRRFTLLLFVALLGGTNRLAAQEKVEVRGVMSVVKIEEVTFGHLSELNGKFKLRATEPRPRGDIGFLESREQDVCDVLEQGAFVAIDH